MISIKVLAIVVCVIALWAVVGSYFYINSSRDQLTTSPVVSYSATCTETNEYDECIAYGVTTTVAQSAATSTVTRASSTTEATGPEIIQKTTTFSNPFCVNGANGQICVSSRNYSAIVSSSDIQSQCCNDSNIMGGHFNGTEIGMLSKVVTTRTLNGSQIESTNYTLTVTAAGIFTLLNGTVLPMSLPQTWTVLNGNAAVNMTFTGVIGNSIEVDSIWQFLPLQGGYTITLPNETLSGEMYSYSWWNESSASSATSNTQLSSQNSAAEQSTISVSACISVGTGCNGVMFYFVVQNVGTAALASGEIMQIYVQDITNPSNTVMSCTLENPVPPGSTLTISTNNSGCASLTGSMPVVSAGDAIAIKIVSAEGSSAIVSTKVISGQNEVQAIILSSATLYGGVTATAAAASTSSFTLSLNNPGPATTITGITLTGSSISQITAWDATSSPGAAANTIDFAQAYAAGNPNAMAAGQVTSFTFYPWSPVSESILTGQTFNYVITFANGQSVSGSLIAQ